MIKKAKLFLSWAAGAVAAAWWALVNNPWLFALVVLVIVIVICVLVMRRRPTPKNRVRAMRMRLHVRMRAGRGFATVGELWLRWSRTATWRKSKPIRPSLGAWHRLTHPAEHSELLGRAQYRHALRASMEQHLLVLAPPRTGKSSLLSALVMHFPGPVLVTSSRTDQFELTSGIRSKLGPIQVFNPVGLGNVPSTIRFDPIDGCRDPQVAIRRADSFSAGLDLGDVEGGGYFRERAGSYLRALFMAAALAGGDLRLVARWVFTSVEQAELILAASGFEDWADELRQLRGPAERAAATVKSVITGALNFMNDPALAQAVLPGGDFDIRDFLKRRGSLYMVSPAQKDTSPLAPLFAVLATEVHFEAMMLAAETPGGRLDAPLLMGLDELANIVPVPVSAWLADSAGRGIQIVTIVHSLSQLSDRYGNDAASTIFETSGLKVILPGVTDATTLEKFTKVSGDFSQREHFHDRHSRHDVVTPAMLRSLPDGYGFVLSGNRAPVVGKLVRGYQQPVYRRAKRRGQAVADIWPVTDHTALPMLTGTRPVPDDAAEPWVVG